jgi:sec-independent protein translocase protein TatB
VEAVFGALDPEKILMILVVALIVIGPQRLPGAARQLGSWWRTLTQFRTKLEQEFRQALPDFKDAFPDLDLPKIPKSPRSAVSGFVRDLIKEEPGGATAAANGNGSLAGDAGASEQQEAVEQRSPADYAPFVDDPSMN